MDYNKGMNISAAGMRAQSMRMRVIAENIANQNSTATEGNEPYRRKLVNFKNVLDRELGVSLVQVQGVAYDQSAFGTKFDPGHPMANAEGYISTTNVKGLVETMDMKDAQRTYQANVSAIEASKKMMLQTIELLK
jgi:flagellar basal-body rod protein FlgC